MILAQIAPEAFPSIFWLAIAPELILGVGAAVVLLVDVQWKPPRRTLGAVVGVVLSAALLVSILQWMRVTTLFSEPAGPGFVDMLLPFGRMVIFDHAAVFARIAVLVITMLGLVAGWELFERLGRRGAEALALVLLSAAGFSLMASSVHLVMIFLGLEVGSISLYVLAGISREHIESDEAAIKYFLLGSVASAIFIYGVALVYAGTGAMHLFAIRNFFSDTILTRPAVLFIGIALMVVGLGFKVSAAPFHSWAPDVYQGAPAGVVGFMAAVAKIGGFAALIRVLFSAFPRFAEEWAPLIAVIAAISMVVGAVLAIVQDDVRRMLAYSGVAHAGFILTGVVAGGPGAQAIWFYLAVYTIQLVGAFGVVTAVGGAGAARAEISSYAGLAKRAPFLALTFSVLLLGMAGLPLTSGFIAKFAVFQEAWRAGFEWLVVLAVVASVAAFYFYIRVIVVMYMQDPEDDSEVISALPARWVLGLVTAATIVLGLIPGPLLRIAGEAISL